LVEKTAGRGVVEAIVKEESGIDDDGKGSGG
jgi:hypothetical protein